MALVTFVDDSAPYLNAQNLNNNFEYLDNKNDYSTSETVIGVYDGKPLYRKVYSIPVSTANTDVNTALNISNLNKVINLSGLVESSGLFVPINYSYSNTQVRCFITSAQYIQLTSAFTGTARVTVEYTKTTD